MELLQLRYFLELARQEHLTKTAESLMISPPALSSTIKRLENELGVSLFDRKKQKLHLNASGRLFYQHVKSALSNLDYAVSAVAAQAKNHIRVAMTNFPIWSEAVFAFEAAHPDIVVDYSLIRLDELNDQKAPFEYDFFLGVIEDVSPEMFESRVISEAEAPVVLMSVNHPLADRDAVRMEELKDESFISTGLVNASAHRYMMALCELAHFEPKRIFYTDYHMRGKMLAENKGINIATLVGWNRTLTPDEQITFVPVARPYLTRTQAISYRKEHFLTPVELEFMDFLTDYLHEHPIVAKSSYLNS